MTDPLRIYTDGSCLDNPGDGGWAWAIDEHNFCWNWVKNTTNQRMELTAVLKAVKHFEGVSLTIVSDSAYVVSCFKDEWWRNWSSDGFKDSTHEAVANWDLWNPLLILYFRYANVINFEKVRGHSGDVMNEFVDDVARMAANQARRS